MTLKCPGCQEVVDVSGTPIGVFGVCPCRQVFRLVGPETLEPWSYERLISESPPLSARMWTAIRGVLIRRARTLISEGIETQLASNNPLLLEFCDTTGIALCLMLNEGLDAYCHNEAAKALAAYVAEKEPETALDVFDVLLHEVLPSNSDVIIRFVPGFRSDLLPPGAKVVTHSPVGPVGLA